MQESGNPSKVDPGCNFPRPQELAYSISVDPYDASHIVVGERSGEVDPGGCSGIWESRDAGQNWSCVLDPVKRSRVAFLEQCHRSPFPKATLLLAQRAVS